MKRLWWIAALASACLCLAACGGQPERPVVAPTGSTAPSVTVTTVATTATTTAKPTTATTAPQEERPHLGLYEADTLTALYEQDAAVRIYPASLVKITTAYTALKYLSPRTEVKVGTELSLVKKGSSLCYIQKGHRLTLYDLLTGLLMSSGNDAAYTVAVTVAREVTEQPELSDADAVAYFCQLMNETAAQLGATDTHYVNPEGWDDQRQYTTVQDLARITSKAMQVPEIREIVSCPQKTVTFLSGQHITWKNTNSLLNSSSKYYYPNATGFKTGSTSRAGKCLVATVQQGDKAYIAIVTDCESDGDRYRTMHALLDRLPPS